VSKLRVHDMAGEFGISSDDLMTLLRSMDISVRSHLSPLTDEQIARVRARWEREKRARAKAPPATSTRRRRGAAAAVEPPPAAAAPVAEAPGVRRRRAVEAAPASPAPDVPTIEAPPPAAPVAAAAAHPRVEPGAPSAPAPAPTPSVSRPAAPERVSPDAARAASAPTPAAPPPQAGFSGAGVPGDDRPRPRPIVPGAPRPRPVASGAPRPVASATPSNASGTGTLGSGSGTAAQPRRDDKRGGGGGGGGGLSGGFGSGMVPAGRRKKGKRGNVDQEAVSANITRTMSALRTGPARRVGRRPDDGIAREALEAQRAADVEREKKTVRVNEFITVSELADLLKVTATQIVGFALKNLGLMVTINQRLDFDQIELIAGEYGFQAVREEEYATATVEAEVEDEPGDLVPRPPVVTIMGHVDHGKTSLLDYIRKTTVVAGEAGGITQHIGAYHVSLPNGRSITFLDTPGHEAFTAMRARGAQVTDIVVLVVAADDQVMPQTVEAISHAKNAGVPIVVAINKIDLPAANVPKVRQDLLQHGVILEEFGGSTLATAISAKTGLHVQELLDQILLQADILELKANPARRATGAVIEAQLDPGKGPVATVLVENGTLRVGDDFICGLYAGRVRALLDERGKSVPDATPAIPVQVLGIEKVPTAGDVLVVVEDATDARETAQRRERLDREARNRRTSARAGVTLEDFMAQTTVGGERRTLRIVIKADQGGPAEALADALAQMSTSEVEVQVIHRGVGAVTESDVLLAKASGAIIVGFHVRPDNNARAAAEREGVEIKLYRIIYEAVADVRLALEGLLRPEQREVIDGEAAVRELFKVAKIGTIAGCAVRSGVITRDGRVRVVRDGAQVYDGRIGSLRRFKDDVREVRAGFECGIGIENFNDLKVGDVIESYRTEEVARTLAPAAQG
jgi:translation initiation factor IF-2